MPQPDKVYIVIRGERGEGGTVCAVYRDQALAEQHVDRIIGDEHFLSCDWADAQEWEISHELQKSTY